MLKLRPITRREEDTIGLQQAQERGNQGFTTKRSSRNSRSSDLYPIMAGPSFKPDMTAAITMSSADLQNSLKQKKLQSKSQNQHCGDNKHYPTTMEDAMDHVDMFLSNTDRLGHHIHRYPTFDARELLLGKFLGKGGFSNVVELRGFLDFPHNAAKKKQLGQQSSQPPQKLVLPENSSFRTTTTTDNDHHHDDNQSAATASEDGLNITNTSDTIPLLSELGYESLDVDMREGDGDADDAAGGAAGGPQHQVRRFSPSETAGSLGPIAEESGEQGRQFLRKNCLRTTGEARYAIKRLRKEIVQDPCQYPSGAMDLAVEALFLADLQHPNIIKLRGIATADPFEAIYNADHYYFLIMDKLAETLSVRMKKWKERKRRMDTIVGRIIHDPLKRKRQALLDERLAAAYDLSAAMAYLKSQKIIHRDLKPENLGFDIRGDIKIFDFGLARELRELDLDPDTNGMYRLSSMTGSLRYMSPEVAAHGTPYNEKCDVYSFTIVLWEMLSLERAYMNVGATQERFMRHVFVEKKRPPIKHTWSRFIQTLLTKGWAHDPSERLEAENCQNMLRNELVRMRHGDDTDLEHVRRRSTNVMDMDEDETEATHLTRRPELTPRSQPRSYYERRSASMTSIRVETDEDVAQKVEFLAKFRSESMDV